MRIPRVKRPRARGWLGRRTRHLLTYGPLRPGGRLRNFIITVLVAAILAIFRDSIAATLGPPSQVVLKYASQWFGMRTNLPNWVFGVVAILIILSIVYAALNNRAASSNREVLSSIITQLEECAVVFTNAEIYSSHPDKKTLLIGLLNKVMKSLVNLYGGHVFRAGILVPDKNNEWLIWYVYHGLPQIEASVQAYYIGSSPNESDHKRGIAGEAYVNNQPILLRYNNRTGPHLKSFKEFEPGVSHAYESFISFPITAKSVGLSKAARDDKIYGILCLDSKYDHTFDKDPIAKSRETDEVPAQESLAAPFLRVIYHLMRLHARYIPPPDVIVVDGKCSLEER